MAANQDIIPHLNAVLKNKLTGINQYFLHARMLKHMGQVKLADYEYKASIDAMKHADMLVDHILSLGSHPNLQELGKLSIGEGRDQMLQNDLALAENTMEAVKKAISLCQNSKDASSVPLLTRISESQQEHMNTIRMHLGSANPNLKDCA